jgi:hypothetical protein
MVAVLELVPTRSFINSSEFKISYSGSGANTCPGFRPYPVASDALTLIFCPHRYLVTVLLTSKLLFQVFTFYPETALSNIPEWKLTLGR